MQRLILATYRVCHVVQGISCEEKLNLTDIIEVMHDQIMHRRLHWRRGCKIC